MPLSLNNVTIAGTLTRDAEIKYTQKGTAIANFSLAINKVWTDEGGKKHEDVTFVEVEAWGRTAEVIGEYTAKGHTILVEGSLKLDQWEDKQTGDKRSKLKVRADRFHFVSKPREQGEERPPARTQRPQSAPPASKPKPPADPDLDAPTDDIPF